MLTNLEFKQTLLGETGCPSLQPRKKLDKNNSQKLLELAWLRFYEISNSNANNFFETMNTNQNGDANIFKFNSSCRNSSKKLTMAERKETYYLGHI